MSRKYYYKCMKCGKSIENTRTLQENSENVTCCGEKAELISSKNISSM